jgi:hypothetical protein
MEPIRLFDFLALPGIQTQLDTSADARNLVRIEGVISGPGGLRKRAVLENGPGRYEAACAAARQAFQRDAAAGYPAGYASLAVPELEIGGVWDEARALAGLARCDLAAGRIK